MMSHTPETSTQCHKEETGRSQPQNKQARAQQLRLLTAKFIQSEFWVKRKTGAALMSQRQRDSNMKNSAIWFRRLSLSY